MAGRGRKKLSDEEKIAREEEKKEKQEQEQKEIEIFKECDYINTLDDELILKFIKTLKTDYKGMNEEQAIKLLFEGFISGCFKFETQMTYTLPKVEK